MSASLGNNLRMDGRILDLWSKVSVVGTYTLVAYGPSMESLMT